MAIPIFKAITGNEELTTPNTPYGALSEFYRAFNARDLDLMAKNWLNSEDVSMDNPLGGIRRGWNEIASVYQRIFSGAASVRVEFFEYTIHHHGHTFLAVGRERGDFTAGAVVLDLAMRTSRWFLFVDNASASCITTDQSMTQACLPDIRPLLRERVPAFCRVQAQFGCLRS